jgi:hypothetical protein
MADAPGPAVVPGLKLGVLSGADQASPRRIPLSEAVRSMATPRVSNNPDEECVVRDVSDVESYSSLSIGARVSAFVKLLATPRGQGGGLSARSSMDPTLLPLMSPRKDTKKKWDGLVTTNDIAHVCYVTVIFDCC